MIDLHTHTIFSDGELIPSELVRRAVDKGYQAIAITDHADLSNIDFIVPRMVKVCKQLRESCAIQVIPGIELTHVPPPHIAELAKEGRRLGAQIIVVHGETIVEPVMKGHQSGGRHLRHRYPGPPGSGNGGGGNSGGPEWYLL